MLRCLHRGGYSRPIQQLHNANCGLSRFNRSRISLFTGGPSASQAELSSISELRGKLRELGRKRKWLDANRLIQPVNLESLIEVCLKDARTVMGRQSSRLGKAKGRLSKRGSDDGDSTPSMLTDIIEAYLFKPTNANVRNLWNILERTRADSTLAENIGVRRLLRIYKICGINSVKGGRKNVRTKFIDGVGEKEIYLSAGQLNAMLMHVVEWLLVANSESRKRYMSTLMRVGPKTLNVNAADLGRGVVSSFVSSLKAVSAKGDAEETSAAEAALADIVLTAFHVLRQSGKNEDAKNLVEEALQGFRPYPARILPEDAFSLAISGCFSAAEENDGRGRDGGSDDGKRDMRRHFRKWKVDQDSLSFLVSLLLNDNHPRVVRLRERVLQVLLSYGQYNLIKTTFESMLSSKAYPDDNVDGGKSAPLVLGTRAHMSLVSAHAALASADGVLTALELVTDEKRRIHSLSPEEKAALEVYSPSLTEAESVAANGLLAAKVSGGLEVGPDKHLYIAALNTSRQALASPRRQRRAYQTHVAKALMDRVDSDGVRVDTRFLLQVAELGCDDKDFSMCTRAVEIAHKLCRVPVQRRAVTSGADKSGRLDAGAIGDLGATHSTSSTSTSRGKIILTTLLENVQDTPADPSHRTATAEMPSNDDLAKIYGYAILCARKSDRPEDCVLLLYYMLQMGLSPSAASITHVLKALFHAEQHDEVIRIFKLMPKWGVQREPIHAATLVDSLCRLGRLKDAWTGLSYMGPLDPAVRDDSRKHLLRQLCFALRTGGRNDRGTGGSKFEYEELLDAIAETCVDHLQSPACSSPTQGMRFARNLVYFMQGTPDDVLEAVLKRILLSMPAQAREEEQEHQQSRGDIEDESEGKNQAVVRKKVDLSLWIGKVQSLREQERSKSVLSGSPVPRSPHVGVLEYGTTRGFPRHEL
jgi:hypothetical protein